MNNLKYVFRVIVILFALYILCPAGRLCRMTWSGAKGFVKEMKEHNSKQLHSAFPPWSYTKQLLDGAGRLRKEGK